MIAWLRRLGCCLLLLSLLACKEAQKPSATGEHDRRYRVTPKASLTSLHFTGNIQALKEYSLVTPLDAVIEHMPVHYGGELSRGQMAFRLHSADLQKQYNEVLTEYLKAKDSFSISKNKFQGTETLWRSGLIPKNTYINERSSLDNARIAMLQSQRKFGDLMDKMGIKDSTLSALSLKNFDKVQKALAQKHDIIALNAPASGILLYPPKSNEDKSQRLAVGSAVKAGQVVALIGDLSGVRVDIDVPEIDVDKIHRGMGAKVRGVALGNAVLEGTLVAINAQAASAGSSSLPVFSATVEVTALSDEQRQRVRVGMSANVELILDTYQQLMLPIQAVRLQKGKSVVQVVDSSGRLSERAVRTGAANGDEVAILDGLKEGEEVVIHGRTPDS